MVVKAMPKELVGYKFHSRDYSLKWTRHCNITWYINNKAKGKELAAYDNVTKEIRFYKKAI